MGFRLLKDLAEILFPEGVTCDICGVEIFEGRLCPQCGKTVCRIDEICCVKCGRKTKTKGLCLECKAQAPLFDRAVSALVYKDGGALLVQKFKNGGAYLKEYFADLIAQKCREFSDADAICFVPSTEKSVKRRGYNQAKLLAYALSERLDLPVAEGALIKIKDTPEQKSLTAAERTENLKGCFKADGKKVKNKKLILVDDVLTTGATAEACCAALKKRGAEKVYFATVASVEFNVDRQNGFKPQL